jgi:hypothetical protein
MVATTSKENGGFPMTRIARCCCGALRAEATGEPSRLTVCHCIECQRRTGSAFGVGAYFPKDQVRTEGPSKIYVRGSDSGRKVELHFCPDCGTSVFWHTEFLPDHVGIAFGTFADPLPWPTASVWEATRHPWVTFDHPFDRFTDQRSTPVTPATG